MNFTDERLETLPLDYDVCGEVSCVHYRHNLRPILPAEKQKGKDFLLEHCCYDVSLVSFSKGSDGVHLVFYVCSNRGRSLGAISRADERQSTHD